jgi:hypothetical protein
VTSSLPALWLIGAFSTLEEALQQVVVEDADLAAAVAAIQDPKEQRVAKRLLAAASGCTGSRIGKPAVGWVTALALC